MYVSVISMHMLYCSRTTITLPPKHILCDRVSDDKYTNVVVVDIPFAGTNFAIRY